MPDSELITMPLPVGSTAVVYCEGQFGEQDGKTANGLVRHSEKYEILSVIDSTQRGTDAGMFLRARRHALGQAPSIRRFSPSDARTQIPNA